MTGTGIAWLGGMSIRLALLLAIIVPGCRDGADLDPPRQMMSGKDPNFWLYVSNQSFDIDPVDIEVRLDGQLAVTGDFLVEGQHSWHRFGLRLAPGPHILEARSEVGDVELAEVVGDHPYAVLDFWYYPPGSSSEPTPPQFSLTFFDQPPQFE